MSIASFDELLAIIQDDLAPCEKFVRDCISPEEKLVIKLSVGSDAADDTVQACRKHKLSVKGRLHQRRNFGNLRINPLKLV
ncbi:hypothetical protein J6590_002937 [Homalodisca vitripennis]|nr:hypothetical protein J6590_002937 [Homalodisca vitripennis]